jgi:hypothetical protein
MIYETDTDMVAIWNGSAWRYLAATTPTNGTVLQVQSTTKTDTFSTASSTFVDVTGLSATITPKSSSSKILVSVYIFNGSDGGHHNGFNIVRNSTNIAQPPTYTYSASVGASFAGSTDSRTSAITHLDSPATTSSVTYKIQTRTSGGTMYVNRRGDVSSVSAVSNITLMEIAG